MGFILPHTPNWVLKELTVQIDTENQDSSPNKRPGEEQLKENVCKGAWDMNGIFDSGKSPRELEASCN